MSKTLRIAQEFMDILTSNPPSMDQAMLKNSFKIVAAHDSGFVHSQLRIEPIHLNKYNTVHGGAIAYLVDVCGSVSMAAKR